MKRTLIESSSLRALGFDAAHNILEAEFTNGLIYRYFGVPRRVYDDFLRAPSKGSFFNLQIRNQYPTEKIAD